MKKKFILLVVAAMAFHGQTYSQGTATVNLIMPGGACATMSYIGVYCEFTFPDNREQPFIVGPLMNKDFTSVSVSPGPIRINYMWLDQSKMQGASYEYIKSSIGTDRERPTKGSYQNMLADGDVKYLSPFPSLLSYLGKKAAYQIDYNDTVYEEVKQEQYEKWVQKISGKKGAVAEDLPSSGPNKIPIVRPQQSAPVAMAISEGTPEGASPATDNTATQSVTTAAGTVAPVAAQTEPRVRKASSVRFGMYDELQGTVGKSKDMDNAGGSIGLDMIMGARMLKQHFFLGAGAGVNWYFYNAENSYAKISSKYMYVPIFANARVFLFGDKKNDVYLDTDLGGFIAIKPETEMKVKGGKTQSYTGETGGGLFFHIGAGVKISSVVIGVGYELRKAKDADGLSSAYFKVGFGM